MTPGATIKPALILEWGWIEEVLCKYFPRVDAKNKGIENLTQKDLNFKDLTGRTQEN